jgi:hypothetical protein
MTCGVESVACGFGVVELWAAAATDKATTAIVSRSLRGPLRFERGMLPPCVDEFDFFRVGALYAALGKAQGLFQKKSRRLAGG